VPLPGQVLDGVNVDATTGTVVLPVTGEVQDGVFFGPASAYEGTYDPITGQYIDPGKANVATGNDYLFAGVSQVAEYPTTADSKAAQLADDVAEVTLHVHDIKDGVTILTVMGDYDPVGAAVWPSEANVSTVETAWGPTGSEYAGALDLTTYVLKSAVIAADYVLTGQNNYTGGDAGTLVMPDAAYVWNTVGDFGVGGDGSTAAMHASDIANCTPSNVRKNTVIDDVTGILDPTGGGGSGGGCVIGSSIVRAAR